MEGSSKQPARVLIIEDDPPQAGVLSRALAGEGREIVLAEDGLKGLELARAGVALVIADYDLPGMNGVELVRCGSCAPRRSPRRSSSSPEWPA